MYKLTKLNQKYRRNLKRPFQIDKFLHFSRFLTDFCPGITAFFPDTLFPPNYLKKLTQTQNISLYYKYKGEART